MKEIRLKADINYDFDLFGITSSIKDYKLAWLINSQLHVNLHKADDHIVEFNEANKLETGCFEFSDNGNRLKLLNNKVYKEKNKAQDYLIPELKHFDFFLLVEGQQLEVTNLTNKLKQINKLEFITKIDVMKLRSKENLIL